VSSPPEDIDRLFADARLAAQPPDGAADRVHDAVLQAIQVAGPAGGAAATGSALGVKIAVLILVVAAGGGLYGLLRSGSAPAVEPSAAVLDTVPAPAADEPPPGEPATPEDELELELVPAPSAAASPSALPRPSNAPPARPAAPEDLLAAELALMKAARTALGSGRPTEALGLLDEHARRFPTGVLAPERRVSRVRALCAVGRMNEARAAYRQLSRGAMRSPHLAALRRSCPGLEPEAP
jgi:hypothetical protein